MRDRPELITEYTVYPRGADPDDIDVRSFAAVIQYRGKYAGKSGGGYSVGNGSSSLSRAGRWGYPQRFQRWQYRWATFEEALNAAREAVDHITVMGMTWQDLVRRREATP